MKKKEITSDLYMAANNYLLSSSTVVVIIVFINVLFYTKIQLLQSQVKNY